MISALPELLSYAAGNFARHRGESAHPGSWDGLIGAWAPELGTAGGTLFDAAGRKFNGTLTAMAPATDWIIGGNPRSPGFVLDYNAANNRVLVPSRPLFALDDLSVVVWVRRDGWAESYARLFVINSFGSGLAITRSGSGDGLLAWVNGSDAGTSQALPDLTWTCVGVTRKGTTCGVYYNGVDVTTDAVWSGSASLTAGQVSIGAQVDGGSRFNGQIGAAYLYDRVLTPSEIAQHYALPLAPFRLARRTQVGTAGGPPPPVLDMNNKYHHYQQMAGAL